MNVYQRALQQPLLIRFEFRKARFFSCASLRLGSPNAQAGYDGTVQVLLTLNKHQYGPYTTNIRTTRQIWNGRKSTRVGGESKALTQQMAVMQSLLEEAHYQLSKKDNLFDGGHVMRMAQWLAKGQDPQRFGEADPIAAPTLTAVYEEFLKVRYKQIENDRRKRGPRQIAESTLNTYKRRWNLIWAYLASIKSPTIPITAINYPFATNLEEWLFGQKQTNGELYGAPYIAKTIALLKQLTTYAQAKGYVSYNPLSTFICRPAATAAPKPLTPEQVTRLETCELPPLLRHYCDSWLIALELCLHYSDFMSLPKMSIIERGSKRYIQNERTKQTGSALVQTVDITPRAERLLAKWGGVGGLCYRGSTNFAKALKKIALLADLRNEQGMIISLEFGQGRDTGLTNRAIAGANGIQLSRMAGWSNPVYSNRYLGNPLAIVEGFVQSSQASSPEPRTPTYSEPFIKIHKTA